MDRLRGRSLAHQELAEKYQRVHRERRVVLVSFHVRDERRHKTQGYGSRAMNLYVRLRPMDRIAGWLRDAGLTVEVRTLIDPDDAVPAGLVIARRPPARADGAPDAAAPGPPPFSGRPGRCLPRPA